MGVTVKGNMEMKVVTVKVWVVCTIVEVEAVVEATHVVGLMMVVVVVAALLEVEIEVLELVTVVVEMVAKVVVAVAVLEVAIEVQELVMVVVEMVVWISHNNTVHTIYRKG